MTDEVVEPTVSEISALDDKPAEEVEEKVEDSKPAEEPQEDEEEKEEEIPNIFE